jgi:hypothetical protein
MDVATAEGREVSRSHVSDSPVPGESRILEQSGQTKNTEESLIYSKSNVSILDGRECSASAKMVPSTLIGEPIVNKAAGTFDVKLNSLPPYNTSADAKLARMSIDKQFRGDLEATNQGEMLSAGTDIQGSAGYVAIERVTGTLNGRSGGFVLQHGAPYLNIVVIPDSGTKDLVGLSGTMQIIIDKGKHSYEFQYSISD